MGCVVDLSNLVAWNEGWRVGRVDILVLWESKDAMGLAALRVILLVIWDFLCQIILTVVNAVPEFKSLIDGANLLQKAQSLVKWLVTIQATIQLNVLLKGI